MVSKIEKYISIDAGKNINSERIVVTGSCGTVVAIVRSESKCDCSISIKHPECLSGEFFYNGCENPGQLHAVVREIINSLTNALEEESLLGKEIKTGE